MKKTKLEKGITLIALIITIVVLLILAVVTIGAIQESKIIAHAKNAASEYKTKSDEENTILDGYIATIEENLPGGSVPKEDEEILWRYDDEGDGYTFLSFIGNVKELVLDEDKEVKAYVGIYNEESDEFECDKNSKVVTKKFSDVYNVWIEESASIETLTLGNIKNGEIADIDSDSSIKNIIFLGTIEKIENHSVEYLELLETVIIQEGVKSIGNANFHSCDSLNSITIPSTVTYIGNIGNGCSSLTSVKINKTSEEIKAMANYPWDVAGKIYDKDNNLVQ